MQSNHTTATSSRRPTRSPTPSSSAHHRRHSSPEARRPSFRPDHSHSNGPHEDRSEEILKPKKRRGALACLECRSRKRKCDGRPFKLPAGTSTIEELEGLGKPRTEWGPCRQCLESSVDCSWPERDRRRRGGDPASTATVKATTNPLKRARSSSPQHPHSHPNQPPAAPQSYPTQPFDPRLERADMAGFPTGFAALLDASRVTGAYMPPHPAHGQPGHPLPHAPGPPPPGWLPVLPAQPPSLQQAQAQAQAQAQVADRKSSTSAAQSDIQASSYGQPVINPLFSPTSRVASAGGTSSTIHPSSESADARPRHVEFDLESQADSVPVRETASESAEIRVSYEYLRPYGPTAINPGLGRVKLSMRATTADTTATPESYGEVPHRARAASASTTASGPGMSSSASLVDTVTHLPVSRVLNSLLDAFYVHFSGIFPFSNRAMIERAIQKRREPSTALVVNCMCALSARFSDHPEIVSLHSLPFCRGTQFADAAKRLLSPLLEIPSADVTAALVYLAYYGLGVNSEAAEWMYAGMAMRMALDLGLHRSVAARSKARKVIDKLLFWCVFILDRLLSIGTGRPPQTPDNQIDISEPDPETEPGVTPAFAANVHLTRLYGRVAELVNNSPFWLGNLSVESAMSSRPPSPGPAHRTPSQEVPVAGPPRPCDRVTAHLGDPVFREELENLNKLEADIISAYDSLPVTLAWSTDNLLKHIYTGDGDSYLQLHLWYYCVLAILYREPFLQARAAYAQLSLSEATEIQKSAARFIQEITVSIPSEYTGILYNNPFLNTCFYVAACCWVAELNGQRGNGDPTSTRSSAMPVMARARSLLTSTAHSNFIACAKVLRQQSQLWLGVGWIAAALAKRSKGLSLQQILKGGVTDTILSEAEIRLISGGGIAAEGDVEYNAKPGIHEIDWALRDFPSEMTPNFQLGGMEQSLWGAEGLFDDAMNDLFNSIVP